MGATRESPHIKMEPEEQHPEVVLQEDGTQGARGSVPLSLGSKEKALFLPGGGEKRDRGEERDVERGTFLGGSCGER